jgi:hypothetical protein
MRRGFALGCEMRTRDRRHKLRERPVLFGRHPGESRDPASEKQTKLDSGLRRNDRTEPTYHRIDIAELILI